MVKWTEATSTYFIVYAQDADYEAAKIIADKFLPEPRALADGCVRFIKTSENLTNFIKRNVSSYQRYPSTVWIVGAQNACPMFKEIADSGNAKNVTEADKGYVYYQWWDGIKVIDGISYDVGAHMITGYEKEESLATAEYIVAKGDPRTNLRMTMEEAGKAIMPYRETVSRGPYSFTAYSEYDKKLLRDFLGIDPSGDDLDTYLSKLDETKLGEWLNYWVKTFADIGRADMATFTTGKYDEYKAKLDALKPKPVEFGILILDPDKVHETLNALFKLITGREATLEDVIAISKAVDFWLPFTNIFAKAIYGMDLETGEAASWEDVSLFDLTIASVQTVLTVWGISELTKLGSSLAAKMTGTAGKGIAEETTLKVLADVGTKAGSGIASEATKTAATAGWKTVVKGFLSGIALEAKAHPLLTLLSTSMLITQLDVIGWGFGLLPQIIHGKAETQSKAIRGDLIRLEDMIEAKDWDGASKLVPLIRSQIIEARENLRGAPADFWKKFGFETTDVDTIFDALETSLDSYIAQFPAVEMGKLNFTKEFILENVKVEDGDTLEFPNHPEVENKIRMIGIDAHEIETVRGKEEYEYLKSLIEGRSVTIKVHEFFDPEKTIDIYGRLLAGVFYNGKDIVLEMLRKFGKDILTATTYQKKYRWIDWDEYKAVAAAAVGKTGEVKVYSKPAYAKIYIDGVDTGKIAIETFELDAGTYIIGAAKEGYKGQSKTVTVVAGELIELRFELEESVLGEEEEEEGMPGEEFKIYITSTPSNAKLYVDDVYTGHWTPSNEKELSDVLHLFTPGSHEIKATKAGMEAKETVTVVTGDNGTINLVLETIGLIPPKEEEEEAEVPKEPGVVPTVFKIYFTSTPSNAKLWIDDIYTHHYTPSNESELKDVLHLLTIGPHKITVTKAGMKGEKNLIIFSGDNGTVNIKLETIGLPPTEEAVPTTLEARVTAIESDIKAIKTKLGI